MKIQAGRRSGTAEDGVVVRLGAKGFWQGHLVGFRERVHYFEQEVGDLGGDGSCHLGFVWVFREQCRFHIL